PSSAATRPSRCSQRPSRASIHRRETAMPTDRPKRPALPRRADRGHAVPQRADRDAGRVQAPRAPKRIDSRAEPPEELDAAIAAIVADHERGASFLARRAALALAAASAPVEGADPGRQLAALHAAARRLAVARPSMAALATTAGRIWLAAADARERSAA